MKSIKNLINHLEQLKAQASTYNLQEEDIQTIDKAIEESKELLDTLAYLKYAEVGVKIAAIIKTIVGLFGDSS